jgi:MYXO-CTERM domain-containing protein
MTISTGNAPMALLKDDGNGPAKIAFAFAGLLGVFALRRRRRGWPLVAVLLLLGATGAVSLSGCGSSSPTTPAGVYEATVTATSGTLSHTASFALQVK